MCVVRTLLPSDCFYFYYVVYGIVRGSSPSTVRWFLSSNNFVYARQRDEARQRAKTDRSVKERKANDNANKETGIINGVLSFQSHLFARHLYNHALFNMSLLC